MLATLTIYFPVIRVGTPIPFSLYTRVPSLQSRVLSLALVILYCQTIDSGGANVGMKGGGEELYAPTDIRRVH